jgi:hypothetical protein
VVSDGKVTLTKVAVAGSSEAALQVSGAHGLLVLVGGEVTGNETGAIAGESGRLKITGSKFIGNGLHCEAQKKSKVFIEQSEFSGSKDGVGIFGQSEAVLHIEKSNFRKEAKYGILTETDTTIRDCSVAECGIAGITFLKGAKGKLSDSRIESNTGDGVRIIGGTPDLKGCTIQKNAGYGVVKAKECIDADASGNTVEGNTSGNIITGEFQTG